MSNIQFIEDSNGDLVDIAYYCDGCSPSEFRGNWPGGIETDYCQYCAECERLLQPGISCKDKECLTCYYNNIPISKEATT